MKKRRRDSYWLSLQYQDFFSFYLIPFLIVLWYSVSFGIGKREFVGLDNYKELFKNTMFLLAVKTLVNICLLQYQLL